MKFDHKYIAKEVESILKKQKKFMNTTPKIMVKNLRSFYPLLILLDTYI